MGTHTEELVCVYFGRSAWPFKALAKETVNAGTTSSTTAKDRDLLLMDVVHDIFDIQLVQNQKILAVALSISCH